MESNVHERILLNTTIGDVALHQCKLAVGGRQWALLHTGATITVVEEVEFIHGPSAGLPYGVALWPSAIALAHEVALREHEFQNRTVLELGAGTGLPGIVAAATGAKVMQTDRQELALHLCRINAERNGARGIEHREADWAEWTVEETFDWILAADILYAESLHSQLRQIFERNLKPTGRVLLADPFRSASLPMLEAMEADGWKVVMSKWRVGDDSDPRSIGVYELTPPSPGK